MRKFFLTLVAVVAMGMATAQQSNHWAPIPGTQYNMTVKGVIVINGVQQSDPMLEIGAFCGEECRGSRKATLFPPTGDYIVTLAVVSNVVSGETITFRIYDHNSQQELTLESLSTLTFADNSNAGNPGAWFPIAFATPSFHFTTAGSWSEASNWQGGTLPGTAASVVIDAACALDQDATVTSLSIADGASLTIAKGRTLSVTGELTNIAVTGLIIKDGAQLLNASANVMATVKKDITAYGASNPDGWYAIASAVDGMAIEGSGFTTPEYDLYRYNEANIGLEWENHKTGHTDFTSFENGRGYLYANNNTFSPAFTGTLNHETVSVAVTSEAASGDLKGFNLIGNPFPHAIYKGAGGAIDDVRLASGYYTLTNEGAWRVHTCDDAILPGQGLLVKSVASGEVSIAKSAAAATAESSGAKEEMERMGVTVTGTTGEDGAYVYFGQGIGLEKMTNFSTTAPSLSVFTDHRRFAIAHVESGVQSIDIYFKNTQNSDFTMKVAATGVRFSFLHLIDNVTGADIDLLQQPEYRFIASGDEQEARFRLDFKVTTGLDENADVDFCYLHGDQLMFNHASESAHLTVIDALGKTVRSVELHERHCSLSGLASGVYVVRMTEGGKSRVQKIVYNN